MKGGTHKRALEAGFTEQQAVFLSILATDTRQEALDQIELERTQAIYARRIARDERWVKIKFQAKIFIAGFLVAVAINLISSISF